MPEMAEKDTATDSLALRGSLYRKSCFFPAFDPSLKTVDFPESEIIHHAKHSQGPYSALAVYRIGPLFIQLLQNLLEMRV